MQPIAFRGLVPWLPVTIYRRHMPHWRQAGATYFVTFRLADSIPESVVATWNEIRRLWQNAHGLVEGLTEDTWQARYAAIAETERRAFEREEARRLFTELDRCHGTCLLRDPSAQRCLRDALSHDEGVRYQAGDGVIMPNHVHWLVMPLGDTRLESLLQSVKRYVSTELGRMRLKPASALWQVENYDHIVRDRAELTRIRQYIAENPIQAKLPEGAYTCWRSTWLDEEAGGTDFRPTQSATRLRPETRRPT